MRVVFMGTASFAVPTMRALVAAGHDIALVLTQPDRPSGRGKRIHCSPVKEQAAAHGLAVIQPDDLNDDSVREAVDAARPDLGVVVAYGRFVPRWLREGPPFGTLNVHGSLLPRHRGAAPVNWAIILGDRESGVSVMKIDAGLDTGPVYATRSTVIGPDETAPELYDRLATTGAALLVETIGDILRGTAEARPQDPNRATLAPRLTRDDGVIQWSESAEAIHNRVRGLLPWPAVRIGFRDSTLKLLATRRVGGLFEAPAGGIVLDRDRLIVVCGDGRPLEVLRIQPENRRPVSGVEFVHGARIGESEAFTVASAS